MAQLNSSADVVAGPTIFVIGWIPGPWRFSGSIFRWRLGMPWGMFTSRYFYAWFGMLLTGNPRPPGRFEGREDLVRFVERKKFRGIFGYDRVRLIQSSEHTDVFRFDCDVISEVGFTPLYEFQQGDRGATLEINMQEKGFPSALASGMLRMRVGQKLNKMHKRLTGHLLPHVEISVAYSLDAQGHTIEVLSTAIPNISVYYNWERVAEYEIWGIDRNDAYQFLTADTNQVFPDVRPRYANENGQPIEGGEVPLPDGLNGD